MGAGEAVPHALGAVRAPLPEGQDAAALGLEHQGPGALAAQGLLHRPAEHGGEAGGRDAGVDDGDGGGGLGHGGISAAV